MFSSDNGATLEQVVWNQAFNLTAGLRVEKQDLYEGGIPFPFVLNGQRK